METTNHEYYVSLEVAKLLKKAGFDWKCRKYYNNGVLFDMEPDEIRVQTPQHSSCDVLVPTLEIVQRWLREVMNFDVLVLFQWRGDRRIAYKYELRLIGRPYALQKVTFDSYEEAQEAGIKKALELILEKGE